MEIEKGFDLLCSDCEKKTKFIFIGDGLFRCLCCGKVVNNCYRIKQNMLDEKK